MSDDYIHGRDAYISRRHSPETIARLANAASGFNCEADIDFKRGFDDEMRRREDDMDYGDLECV